MTLDFGASYILQNDQNMTNQGTYNNPLVGAYLFPRSNDWSDISMYERYDAARKIYTQYWPVGDEGMVIRILIGLTTAICARTRRTAIC